MMLFLAGAYLLFAPQPASAAQLLDVRIGEYDGFTRVVLEMDSPSSRPQIEIPSNGQLSIVFDQTDVNLIRKIPVERSRHIEDLQFWQHNANLSVVLLVDYPHFRFETFRLSNPPRIAVDIFPMAPPISDSAAPTTSTRPAESPSEPPVEPDPQVKQDPPVEEDTALQVNQDNSQSAAPLQRPAVKPETPEQRAPAESAVNKAEVPNRKIRTAESKQEIPAPPSQPSRQTAFRLQFFLVIGLVVITIGILILLMMMLFARHRFSEVKTKLNTGDFLKQQDEKINALNSQIKEQFERYDKA